MYSNAPPAQVPAHNRAADTAVLVSLSDSVSERLRSWSRKPMGSARAGSNPVAVVSPQFLLRRFLGRQNIMLEFSYWRMAAWPSGLRRQLQALVRKGVGSNPTAVNYYCAMK